MDDLNRRLCVTYIHQHVLKGIARPVPLFRLSERSVRPGNPRFEALIWKLVRESDGRHAEITALIAGESHVTEGE